MSYRILFENGSHKRTCTLNQKPDSLNEIYYNFQKLFPDITQYDNLANQIQYFDPGFEEWVDLLNSNEMPDHMVKIRFGTQKISKTQPKNTQSNYSFKRNHNFKSHIESLIKEAEKNSIVLKEKISQKDTSERPKSAEKNNRSMTPTFKNISRSTNQSAQSGEEVYEDYFSTSIQSRPKSAGSTRIKRKRKASPVEWSLTSDVNNFEDIELMNRNNSRSSSSTGRRTHVQIKENNELDDQYINISKPSFKVSKKKNYTTPVTPMVLQRSIDYREHYIKLAKQKLKKSNQSSYHNENGTNYSTNISNINYNSVNLNQISNSSYTQQSSTQFSNLSQFSTINDTTFKSTNSTTRSLSNSQNLDETKSSIQVDSQLKKKLEVQSAAEALSMYNMDLYEMYLLLQIFEPNIPVPVFKIIDSLWGIETEESISVVKQLQARGLLKYEDHHVIIQNHHHEYIKEKRGDPYQVHIQFLESLSVHCNPIDNRFRRPSVEALRYSQISIDEVDWCTFSDGSRTLSARRYFFRQLPYHLIGCKKFHLLAQLLLKPAFIVTKISLWKEIPEILLHDFQYLEEEGMLTQAHIQLKSSLIMSLDYLKLNDHEIISQLYGRLQFSNIPEIQTFLKQAVDIMHAKPYTWIQPQKYSGLYSFESGIKLISAPGGCVVTDENNYIFNAHGRIAYQRNIHTGLVEQQFPILDETPAQIIALEVTPNGEKLIVAVNHENAPKTSNSLTRLKKSVQNDLSVSSAPISNSLCSLRVWNIKTGSHLRRIDADVDTSFIDKIISTKDSRYIITANNIPVRVRNVHHHALKEVAESKDKVTHYAIQVYDISKGRLLKIFKGHKTPVVDIQLSSSGNYLVSASKQSIHLWDCTNITIALRKEIMKFRINDCKSKTKLSPLTGTISLDSNEKFIFAATKEGILQLDFFTGSLLRVLASEVGHISTFIYDTNMDQLVIGIVENSEVQVYDVKSDDLVRQFQDFYNPAKRILLKDDHYIVDSIVDYRYFQSNRNRPVQENVPCVTNVVIVPYDNNSAEYRVLVHSKFNISTKNGAIISFDLKNGTRHNDFAYVEGDMYMVASSSTAAIRSANDEGYTITIVDLNRNGEVIQELILQQPCSDLCLSDQGYKKQQFNSQVTSPKNNTSQPLSPSGNILYYISPDKQHICALDIITNLITETHIRLTIHKIFLCANNRFLVIIQSSIDKRPLLLLDVQSLRLVTNRNALPYVNSSCNFFMSRDRKLIWIHSGNFLEVYDIIHDEMLYAFESNVENVWQLKPKDNAHFTSVTSLCHIGNHLVTASYREKKIQVFGLYQSQVDVPRDAKQFSSRQFDPSGHYKKIVTIRCKLIATFCVDCHLTSIDAIQIGNKLHIVGGIESSENSLCFAEMDIKESSYESGNLPDVSRIDSLEDE